MELEIDKISNEKIIGNIVAIVIVTIIGKHEYYRQ